MKKSIKILLVVFTSLLILSFSVISSFAAIEYDSGLQGLDSFTIYMLSDVNSQIYSATVTSDCYDQLGNVMAVNLSAVTQLFIDEADYPDDSIEITFIFGGSSGRPLSSDYFVIGNTPGFTASWTAAGKSVISGSNVTSYPELASSFTYHNSTYNLYNTASSSASGVSLIRDVYNFRVTLTAQGDDSNGFQLFTAQDLADQTVLLTVGTAFWSYASALNSSGYTDGYHAGFNVGSAGKADAVKDAYQQGQDYILNSGVIQDAYDEGFLEGSDIAAEDAYWTGYNDAAAIGGFNLAQIPDAYLGTAYNYIVQLFDFELFGWSILALIGAFMVLIVILWVLRKLKVF